MISKVSKIERIFLLSLKIKANTETVIKVIDPVISK